MSSIVYDIKKKYRNGNLLIKVIFVNVGIYLAMILLNIVFKLFTGVHDTTFVDGYVYPFLALHSNFLELFLKPWTIITHMFIHSLSVWHIAFNMLILYSLGTLYLNYFSQKQLFGLYILGGIIGALSLIVISNISPFFTSEVSAIGASAAVMAITIAVCAYAPKNEILLFGVFKIQLQWVALILVFSDLIYFFTSNTGGHVAHLGGAITGFWFANSIKKGKDITKPVNKVLAAFSNAADLFRKKSKLNVAHSNVRNMTDEQYNKLRKATQEEIDAILDKIGKNGYDSLSKAEKEMLFKFSKK